MNTFFFGYLSLKWRRLIRVVLLFVTVFWVLLQFLGSNYGWDFRLIFFFDFSAIIGFLWALLVLARAFQKNNRDGDN